MYFDRFLHVILDLLIVLNVLAYVTLKKLVHYFSGKSKIGIISNVCFNQLFHQTKNKHDLDELNCNNSILGEHTLRRPIMLCSRRSFHMPATHPQPIMLYQLSGMLVLTRKNVLVFVTTSKTGPNPTHSPSLLTTLSFPNSNLVSILKKGQHLMGNCLYNKCV